VKVKYKKRRYPRSYHLRQRILNRKKVKKQDSFDKRVQREHNKSQSNHNTINEKDAYSEAREHFEAIKHKMLHLDWFMFDLQFGISLDDIVQSFDPLKAIKTIKALNSEAILKASGIKQAIPAIGISLGINVAMFINEHQFGINHQDFKNPIAPTYHVITANSINNAPSELHHSYLQALASSIQQDLPIVIDTGASTSITPELSDFVGELKPTYIKEILQLSGNTQVVGKGIVEWEVCDLWNVKHIIRTEAYYVPTASIRLYSPQSHFIQEGKGECNILHNKLILKLPEGGTLEFPYNTGNNLPLMLKSIALGQSTPKAGLQYADVLALSNADLLATYLSVSDQTNQNITASQKELLLLHHKLGHINLQWVQRLCSKPTSVNRIQVLSTKHPNISTVEKPICTACQFAKQRRRTPATNSIQRPPSMKLKQNHLQPGDCVSMDQYISGSPGRLPHTKGRESKQDKFNGGTIFTDHATNFTFIKHQVSMRAGSTLKSKRAFEQEAATNGVKIKSYLTDNTPFGSSEFLADIEAKGQVINFSGVGAHHQNGVAERSIQTITKLARAMMLHATLMWPDSANLELWPFAMDHAVYLYNHMPRPDTFKAPIELFSKTAFSDYTHLHRLHVFGCPVYVLDPKLQDEKKLPKWNPRSRRGQFLGYSPDHATTVGRILNLKTGFVSPQYHVIYDDKFTSVPNSESGGILNDKEFTQSEWLSLIQTGSEKVVIEPKTSVPLERAPSLHDDWLTDKEIHFRNQNRRNRQKQSQQQHHTAPPSSSSASSQQQNTSLSPQSTQQRESLRECKPMSFSDTSSDSDELSLTDVRNIPDDFTVEEEVIQPEPEANIEPPSDPPLSPRVQTRSGRQVKKPKRLTFESMYSSTYNPTNSSRKVKLESLNQQFLMGMQWHQLVDALRSHDYRAFFIEMASNTDQYHNTIEEWNPMALSSKANSTDNPNWHEAMNGPYKDGYLKAMETEISTLQDNMDSWDIVDRQEWMNIIPSTWAFKCKRFPSGEVRKLKARFCARGDKQIEGVDFFDTYAPVTNWTTVRIMLIMSLILNLSTKQVDYTAAFVHADIDEPPHFHEMSMEEQTQTGVYIEMPRGFEKPGKVLKLKKSLYGLKQSPRNFFLHLKSKLETVGLRSEPEIDPCLFISDKVICLIYVDDTLFFSPKQEYIDEIISKLQNEQNLALEVEDTVAGFLGVHIERRDDGSIKLTQKGLIKRIIEAINISHLPRKFTPAKAEPLIKDTDGPPANSTYSYPSVIGMLQYLQGHSRPDITYAVSQCARFTHCPRRSHEQALERIGQYLKLTMDEGLILKPTSANEIDIFVDADFAGLWPFEDKLDPTCVKSRTGYVITVAQCPVIWCSKLQSEIALSTMEAEYYALSYCMRAVLPFKRTLMKVMRNLGFKEQKDMKFKTSIWEDNAGALNLAKLEPGRFTPRSKHYAIKYHWFRSHLKPNSITVNKIETRDQKADILTKGLRKDTFESIRKLLCGW